MPLEAYFDEHELAVLRERAQRIVHRAENDEIDGGQTALVLHLGDEAYALPLAALVAVYQRVKIVRVPCVPPFVGGIANIRGRTIPVFRLRKLLQVPGEDVLSEGFVVVVMPQDRRFTVGLHVEHVGDVVPLEKVTPFETAPPVKSHYFSGVLPDHTVVLNIEAVLADPILQIDETVG